MKTLDEHKELQVSSDTIFTQDMFNNLNHHHQLKLSRVNKWYYTFFNNEKSLLSQYKFHNHIINKKLNTLSFSITKIPCWTHEIAPITHNLTVISESSLSKVEYLMPLKTTQALHGILSDKTINEDEALQKVIAFFEAEKANTPSSCIIRVGSIFNETNALQSTYAPEIIIKLVEKEITEKTSPGKNMHAVTDTTGIPHDGTFKPRNARRL